MPKAPLVAGLALLLFLQVIAPAADLPAAGPSLDVAPASSEGEKAIRNFAVATGLDIGLFAAEPMLANPVAFTTDEKGRWYVVNTFRLYTGVPDASEHPDWVVEDLQSRTVEDREALLRRKYEGRLQDLTNYAERITRIEDTQHAGRADRAVVFADGFRSLTDGLGAGVLARHGKVWFADIPSLWQLSESAGPTKLPERRALHTGFGVHVGYIGHDLHGLRFGPDGKIYFTIGDRGLHVPLGNRMLDLPDCGAVLRCDPDGSNLEIFATGLRNPQKLAFDQYGNLFTVDNNSDVGDRARCVYVVEGGDSGWRIGWQFLNTPVPHGAWMSEKIWQTQNDEQPACIVPPFGYLGDGPAGLTFASGTGLPERYANHFFLSDFRGTAGNSGVHSFAVRPKGASFEMADVQHFLWSILATDVEVGTDSGVYVLDWVNGWNKTGKGRIYRVVDSAAQDRAAAAETQKLIEQGLDDRNLEELATLLAHTDQRVRLEAQFALVDRGAVEVLQQVFAEGNDQLARLHALWGLGQIAAHEGEAAKRDSTLGPVLKALDDRDPEIRGQSARVLGDRGVEAAFAGLVKMVADEAPGRHFSRPLPWASFTGRNPPQRCSNSCAAMPTGMPFCDTLRSWA